MNNDFVSVRGLSVPRRVVLQGLASVLGCAVTPSAFAAAAKSCRLTEPDILGPFYRFGAPFQTQLGGPDEPGERLIISVCVYSSGWLGGFPHTLIELYQAHNGRGYYTDNQGKH